MVYNTTAKAVWNDVDLNHAASLLQSNRPILYAVLGAGFLLAYLLQSSSHNPGVSAPLYKASRFRWLFSAESLLKDSYHRFRDRVYLVRATEGLQLMVPSNYVTELKKYPEEVLSARDAISDALQSKWTKFWPGRHVELLTFVVRTRLTQNLVKLAPILKQELDFIISTDFPACNDWTPVNWHSFSLRTISRLGARAFVGPELCRDKRWLDTTVDFAVHVFMAGSKLQFFPEWMRPLAQYLVSDIAKIHRNIQTARDMIKPILEQRLRDLDSTTCEDPPNDILQWFLDGLPEDDKADLATHAELQLVIAAAATHTTNSLVCECMYDLAANEELQEELREEARQVLEVNDGWRHKENMAMLKKMDSFMREVHRLRGNIVSFARKVRKPITLSDGTELPAGTRVIAPAAGIHSDERFFPDPSTLDAMRFHRLRQESEEANNRLQFTSLGDTYINFGAGKHACPGRFFAGNEVKLILARFLLAYDIRLRPGRTGPRSICLVMTKTPNPILQFEFRRRQD
ncbi:hypothetical protein JDV02_010178 [Purpureocillium takamizusanense]|uniref:Cytochrome P450 n=1 Tax=Purpureocillium takamizusanense TaxID=2060973 RepID=A0A9Q8QTK3_9HYPO|nr:uncharacterized protein JDV02_010178 [Purpureocillium takamizusanense]UNI24434.1 hypothetical protein JDV02_010178 [Purpureocillium takamizusanense]